MLTIWNVPDQSMLYRSRDSGGDFWWSQLPCGPVLTPISCTKSTIHSAHEHSPIVPKQVLYWQFGMWDQSMLHRSRNSGRNFWVWLAPLPASSYTHLLYWTSSLVGQFLHPSPVQINFMHLHYGAVHVDQETEWKSFWWNWPYPNSFGFRQFYKQLRMATRAMTEYVSVHYSKYSLFFSLTFFTKQMNVKWQHSA